MTKQTFQTFLAHRLRTQALPGRTSQLKMVPRPLDENTKAREMEASPSASVSSVLILLFQNTNGQWELVLTLRSQNVSHPGQISLPGGRAEAHESLRETALRETCEEVGIHPEAITIVGKLSKLNVNHSNNIVTPVIGFLEAHPEFTLNPAEVEEVFTVPLDALLNKENLTSSTWDLSGTVSFNVPYWDIHQVPLWGATAMILSEFLELYREFKNKNTKSK